MTICLGPLDGDHLELTPLRRASPDADDPWEADWLDVTVRARAGAFAGAFEGQLRTDELAAFAAGLDALAPEGTATLESSEGWVRVRLRQVTAERLEATCELCDDPTGGASLRFVATLAAAGLPAIRAALADALAAFPVLGSPDSPGGSLLEPPDAAGEPGDPEAP